jgi:CheY-like chemotaxis protein
MTLGTSPRHILATDDDPDIRALLAAVLDDEGYRVSLSSIQDVAEVARLTPDLILLDYWDATVGAPSDFLDRLKAEGTTAAIPVVVLTGARRQADAQAAHFTALGVTVVLKPFAIDDLLTEIGERLGASPGDAS